MRQGGLFVLLLVALATTGCIRKPGPRTVAAAPPPVVVSVPPPPIVAAPRRIAYVAAPPILAPAPEAPYRLDSGDKLRVVVFGQEGLTNTYSVDANGAVTLPLIGAVPARGLTTAGLAQAIAARLRRGFIREPHVAVEIEIYRPFFILGEVTAPGQYAYVANMTVETAVAIAGGFTPRAFKRKVKLTRKEGGGVLSRSSAPLIHPVMPGDTITVLERWF